MAAAIGEAEAGQDLRGRILKAQPKPRQDGHRALCVQHGGE
jgi:hypothetical protein